MKIPVWISAILLLSVLFSDVAASSAISGSPAQVIAAVDASPSITSLPQILLPNLSSFASTTGAYARSGVAMFALCDPYGSAKLVTAPRPCFLGDTSSKRTIAIVGDSNVGNWLPALSLGLKPYGYRLAVFGFSGCPTPDLVYTSKNGGPKWKDCDTWHNDVLPAIRNVHPFAIAVVSAAAYLSTFTNAEWELGMSKLFKLATLGSPNTKRIVLGSSPFFQTSVPACISVMPNPQACSVNYPKGTSSFSLILSRDAQVASASDATLVPASQWFCAKRSCSPIIKDFIVYSDMDHVTIAYGEYLANVMTLAVVGAAERSR